MILLNIYKTFLFILFFGNIVFCQTEYDDAVKYSLNLTRAIVRAGEVTTLTADLKIMKDFYVYSSHPEKSLSPTNIEWQDSSFFSDIGIIKEPNPKTKYDPMFEMDIAIIQISCNFRRN